jgi:hypothetical protein
MLGYDGDYSHWGTTQKLYFGNKNVFRFSLPLTRSVADARLQ